MTHARTYDIDLDQFPIAFEICWIMSRLSTKLSEAQSNADTYMYPALEAMLRWNTIHNYLQDEYWRHVSARLRSGGRHKIYEKIRIVTHWVSLPLSCDLLCLFVLRDNLSLKAHLSSLRDVHVSWDMVHGTPQLGGGGVGDCMMRGSARASSMSSAKR